MPIIMGHKVIYGNPLDALEGKLKDSFFLQEMGKGCFIPLAGPSKWYPNDFMKWMARQKITLPDGKERPQFYLLGLPECLRNGDGSAEDHFAKPDVFAKLFPEITFWKERVASFLSSVFSGNKADADSIRKAVFRFATHAIVCLIPSDEPIYHFQYASGGYSLPKEQSERYVIVSAVTFTMAEPCLSQIAWLGVRGDGFEELWHGFKASSKPASEALPFGFELPSEETRISQGWRGKGLGSFMLICVIKQLICLKNAKKDTSKGGPEVYLQCTTVDKDARSFYLKQGFKPIVPQEVCSGNFIDMANIGEYQCLDLNCRNFLPGSLMVLAQESNGTWIDCKTSVFELMHLAYKSFGKKATLPRNYLMPPPWNVQREQYCQWPLRHLFTMKILNKCSEFLSYFNWQALHGENLSSHIHMNDAVPYAHCIDKQGNVKTLSSICSLSRIHSNMNSYLNDEMMNMFAGWLYATFPGGFVYVPPAISRYSSLAAKLFPKVLNGEVTGDQNTAAQYVKDTRALRGWLLGKGEIGMKRPFVFFQSM